jgi:hypothetical protein
MFGCRLRATASSAPAVGAPEIRRARETAIAPAAQARLVPALAAVPRGEDSPAGSLAASAAVVQA